MLILIQKGVMATLLWDKVDFRKTKIPRDRKGQHKMIKEWIYQEDIAILNVYALNNRVSKYMKPR